MSKDKKISRQESGRIIWDDKTIEYFKELYYDRTLKVKDIAEIFGFTRHSAVSARANVLGIPSRQKEFKLQLDDSAIGFIRSQIKDGVTQKDIAEHLGISKQHLSKYITANSITILDYDKSTHKMCRNCKKVLPLDDFYIIKNSKHKHKLNKALSKCKKCQCELQREREHNKKDIRKSDFSKNWSQEDKDKLIRLYEEEDMNVHDICKEFKIQYRTLKSIIATLGLIRKNSKFFHMTDEIKEFIIVQKRNNVSNREIADHFGLGLSNFYIHCKKHNIDLIGYDKTKAKKCSRCHKVLPFEEFSQYLSGPKYGKYNSSCRKCANEYNRERAIKKRLEEMRDKK